MQGASCVEISALSALQRTGPLNSNLGLAAYPVNVVKGSSGYYQSQPTFHLHAIGLLSAYLSFSAFARLEQAAERPSWYVCAKVLTSDLYV